MEITAVEEIREMAGSCSILYAEDDPVIRDQFLKMLRRLQFNVDAVSDGVEAMACFADKTYDLIITDIAMPGMDGLHFIEKVREKNPMQNIVVISGFNDRGNLERFQALNVVETFSKPVAVSDFIARLIPIIRTLKGKR